MFSYCQSVRYRTCGVLLSDQTTDQYSDIASQPWLHTKSQRHSKIPGYAYSVVMHHCTHIFTLYIENFSCMQFCEILGVLSSMISNIRLPLYSTWTIAPFVAADDDDCRSPTLVMGRLVAGGAGADEGHEDIWECVNNSGYWRDGPSPSLQERVTNVGDRPSSTATAAMSRPQSTDIVIRVASCGNAECYTLREV